MYELNQWSGSVTLPQEVNSQGKDPDKEILPLNSEKITETEGVYFSVIRVFWFSSLHCFIRPVSSVPFSWLSIFHCSISKVADSSVSRNLGYFICRSIVNCFQIELFCQSFFNLESLNKGVHLTIYHIYC